MYRAGYRRHKPHVLLFLGVVAGICVVIAVAAWIMRGGQSVQNAPAVTHTVSVGGPTKTFDENLFSFDLPSDWQMSAKDTGQYTLHSTKKYEDNRTLNIYVDKIPADFAIDRLLPVQTNDGEITPATVSDDCRNFTGVANNTEPTQSLPDTPAKWQGIDFICDLSHYNRNAVGTGMLGSGINVVSLSTPANGKHQFFFVYIDHNITPNYNIFYDMLSSFMLK
jgi:hypothetical protein